MMKGYLLQSAVRREYHCYTWSSGRQKTCAKRVRGERAKMGRRVLVIAAVLLVLGFAYYGYTNYDAGRAGSSGEVYSNDPPTGKAKPSAAATSGAADTKSTSPETIVYPTEQSTNPSAATAASDGNSAPTGQTTRPIASGSGTPATGVPATDSISPNPPNGMAFSGTGKYQIYRQGNITWRLDTSNGRTCILFATEEEWKKPQVLRAGCGER
jgi:hypothetical protein